MQQPSSKRIQQLLHLPAQPLGSDTLGVHEQIQPELILSPQRQSTGDTILKMRHADRALKALEPVARENILNDALHGVRAALEQELGGGVALEEGDDAR
jgi:hypothetical protein